MEVLGFIFEDASDARYDLRRRLTGSGARIKHVSKLANAAAKPPQSDGQLGNDRVELQPSIDTFARLSRHCGHMSHEYQVRPSQSSIVMRSAVSATDDALDVGDMAFGSCLKRLIHIS